MKKIYLAGPVTGLSYDNSEGWRDAFKERIKRSPLLPHVGLFSPLRAKHYLQGESSIAAQYEGTTLSSQKGIMSRDHWDVITADALIIDFSGSQQVSIGTVMEIAWAYERRIPIIAVVDELHTHPMLLEAISFPVKDLDEALHVLESLFVP
jgi:nucleoside 2-deoxyribosyltransferase